MRLKFLAGIVTVLSCLGNCGTHADEPKSQRTQVVDFLRKHVIDKSLFSPASTFVIDGGRVEVNSEEQATYTGLIETPEGFFFDLTSVSKATLYDMGADGKRASAGRDWGGVRVYRYEVKELRSTKALAGFCRLVSTTAKGKDPTGNFTSLRFSMSNDRLQLIESTVDYVDFISTKGLFKPGGLDTTSRFTVSGGQLRLEQELALFDVDPTTMKRTAAKDKLPIEVFQESEPRK